MCLRSNTKGVEISGIDSGKLGTLYSAARQQEKEWNFGTEQKKKKVKNDQIIIIIKVTRALGCVYRRGG